MRPKPYSSRGNLKENGVSRSATTRPNWTLRHFIFRSHFIMPLIRKKIWCDAGRVYGSTVLHATRRIQESGRIWMIIFSSNRVKSSEHIYINCGLLWEDNFHTLFVDSSGSRRPTPSVAMRLAAGSIISFGSLLAWREGAMHQRSSNKKCQTIIEGTELRRTHTANRSTVLFNVRGWLPFNVPNNWTDLTDDDRKRLRQKHAKGWRFGLYFNEAAH